VNHLVPFTVMVRKYFSTLRSVGSCRIGLGCLTHNWSLMALKIDGELSGIKCSVRLKAWSGLGERIRSTCPL